MNFDYCHCGKHSVDRRAIAATLADGRKICAACLNSGLAVGGKENRMVSSESLAKRSGTRHTAEQLAKRAKVLKLKKLRGKA